MSITVKDEVESAWEELKDDNNKEIDWMLCGYESKKEIKRDYDQEEAGYEQKEEKKDPVDMEISNSP